MSRASIVGMLIAAEVLIAGMALYTIAGHGRSFAGMHSIDFSGAAVAPIAAGFAPHVAIDDPASRVEVNASTDGLVHVRDLTQLHGAFFSNAHYPQLNVTRTLDGVRIERPHSSDSLFGLFGFLMQRIEVEVPQGSRVDVARCSGASVQGVAGGVSVRSVDGRVTLADVRGSVEVRSDDGRIELQNVAATSLIADTRDGRIEASGLDVAGDATLQTADGPIRVALARDADVTIDASTRDGRISVDGNSLDREDVAQRTIRLGSGAARMTLSTGDGSIHILTNGEPYDHGL